jgi:glycosyltransferase involved in cell wall biosynthesis
MDLGVLSSMPRQETLSVAALEIMSAGVPMVATRVGFMSEIVIPGRTGLLVAPGEAQDLGRAMAELLRDDSRRLAMGQAAQDMVAREYGLDSMARSFEDLFQTLRSKKNPSRLRP